MSARRRRPSRHSRSNSSGVAVACVLAACTLLAVMGLTRVRNDTALPAVKLTPRTAPPVVHVPQPVVRKKSPLVDLGKVLKDVKRTAQALRAMKRGPDFERTRIDALAQLSTARQELGAYLDEHPDDDKGHHMWDRLQGMYVALKKF